MTIQRKREIKKLIIHCSASDYKTHDNIETIRKWHVEENGWSDIGYHFVIVKSGGIFVGRDAMTVGAHAKGHNHDSLGICMTGDTILSSEQLNACISLCRTLMMGFGLKSSDVIGHCEIDPGKTCPNLDMTWFRKNL